MVADFAFKDPLITLRNNKESKEQDCFMLSLTSHPKGTEAEAVSTAGDSWRLVPWGYPGHQPPTGTDLGALRPRLHETGIRSRPRVYHDDIQGDSEWL